MSDKTPGSVREELTAENTEEGREHGGESRPGMGRRAALKALATTAVALPMVGSLAACSPDSRSLPVVDAGKAPSGGVDANGVPLAGPRGTKSDPDLLKPKIDWPLQLTASEMATLTALCDMIIPADAKSPSASAVGAPGYINEWASRPGGDASLVRVRGGLAWLDRESQSRFGKRFHLATNAQRTAICDDICYVPKAKPEHVFAAQFFDTIRDQTATAFYTTPAGWKDLGYIGNVALPKFEGPNAAIRKQIGL